MRKVWVLLISKTIYMQSGNIGPNNKPVECSNGCGPMWKVAWVDYAKTGYERLDKYGCELKELRTQVAKLRAEVERLKEFEWKYNDLNR